MKLTTKRSKQQTESIEKYQTQQRLVQELKGHYFLPVLTQSGYKWLEKHIFTDKPATLLRKGQVADRLFDKGRCGDTSDLISVLVENAALANCFKGFPEIESDGYYWLNVVDAVCDGGIGAVQELVQQAECRHHASAKAKLDELIPQQAPQFSYSNPYLHDIGFSGAKALEDRLVFTMLESGNAEQKRLAAQHIYRPQVKISTTPYFFNYRLHEGTLQFEFVVCAEADVHPSSSIPYGLQGVLGQLYTTKQLYRLHGDTHQVVLSITAPEAVTVHTRAKGLQSCNKVNSNTFAQMFPRSDHLPEIEKVDLEAENKLLKLKLQALQAQAQEERKDDGGRSHGDFRFPHS